MRPDTVRFWLNNRQVYGLVNAKTDNEILVSYQRRYYVVKGDTAVMKSGRPLRFSASTLPTAWKKVINSASLPGSLPLLDFDIKRLESDTQLSSAISSDKPVKLDETSSSGGMMVDLKDAKPVNTLDTGVKAQEIKKMEEGKETSASPKRAKRSESKNNKVGEPIVYACPYCNHRAEAPSARKDGKPFFQTCERCHGEFAVRIVPVTVYQAEVAAFPRKGSQP